MEVTTAPEQLKPDPETVSALLAHLRDALDLQLEAADAADAKAFQLGAAGSVVIGLVAVGTKLAVLHGHRRWVLSGAVIAYLGAMAAIFLVVRVREFAISRNADQIWETHWDSSVRDFEWATMAQISKGYAGNRVILKQKARALRTVLVLIGLEVGLIGVALLWP